MTKYVVSACLAGCECRYDGKAKTQASIQDLVKSGQALAVCPEELGGLPTPRPPSEQQGEKVVTIDGNDVTDAFKLGAEIALNKAIEFGATHAILKSKSPMCGFEKVYDGNFQGNLIEGNGEFTKKIIEYGLVIQTVE
jgi:uncharacterized protein YbbK (DUF523 family)